MLRIALCDDNHLQQDFTKELIDAYLAEREIDNPVVTLFYSGYELLKAAREEPYDIYLLDMVMPDINGIETATMLRMQKDTGLIIFLTGAVEYAVQSYDVDAFYYLLKPVDTQKLYRILDKAREIVRERSMGSTFRIKLAKGSVADLPYSDVAYITMENRSVSYHLKDGRVVCGAGVRGKFKEETAQFSSERGFAPAGVTTMINLKYIDTMDKQSVLLNDGTVLYPPKAACSTLYRQWLAFKNN